MERPLRGQLVAGKRVVREVSWVTEVSALGDLMEKRRQTFSTGNVGGRSVAVEGDLGNLRCLWGLEVELPVGLVYMGTGDTVLSERSH